MAEIKINTAFAQSVERFLSGGNDPSYEYHCDNCGAEYVTKDHELKYCDSEKCVDKDIRLHGPYLHEQC